MVEALTVGREDRVKADAGRIVRGVGNEKEGEQLETGGGNGRETGLMTGGYETINPVPVSIPA